MNSNNILHSLSQKPVTSFVLYTDDSKHKKTKDLSKISAKINEALKSPMNFNSAEKKNLKINLDKISRKIKKRNQKVKFVQKLKLPVVGCIARCLYRKSTVPPITIPDELQDTKKTSQPITKLDKGWNDHLKSIFQKDSRVHLYVKNDKDPSDFIAQELSGIKAGEACIYLCLDNNPSLSHLMILGKDPKLIYDIIGVSTDGTLSKMFVRYPNLDSLIEGEGMGELVFRENL